MKPKLIFSLLMFLIPLTRSTADAQCTAAPTGSTCQTGNGGACMIDSYNCDWALLKSWAYMNGAGSARCVVEPTKPSNDASGTYTSMNCNTNVWPKTCNGGYHTCDGNVTCPADHTITYCTNITQCGNGGNGSCNACQGGYHTGTTGSCSNTRCDADVAPTPPCNAIGNQCNGLCTGCQGGYTLCANTCYATQWVGNCNTYDCSHQNCTACNTGFVLTGGACVGATLKLSGASVGAAGPPFTIYQATYGVVGLYLTSGADLGLSTGAPAARLDVLAGGATPDTMAQLWRDSGGNIISSMNAVGFMRSVKFIGDGSGLTNIAATQVDLSTVTARLDAASVFMTTATMMLDATGLFITTASKMNDATGLYITTAAARSDAFGLYLATATSVTDAQTAFITTATLKIAAHDLFMSTGTGIVGAHSAFMSTATTVIDAHSAFISTASKMFDATGMFITTATKMLDATGLFITTASKMNDATGLYIATATTRSNAFGLFLTTATSVIDAHTAFITTASIYIGGYNAFASSGPSILGANNAFVSTAAPIIGAYTAFASTGPGQIGAFGVFLATATSRYQTFLTTAT